MTRSPRMTACFAAALLAGFGGRSTSAAQEFEWFFDMHTGSRTAGVAAADFDRDGDLDLAFAIGEHWSKPTPVYFNDGRGNFTEMQRLEGRYQKGQAIGATDIDGDGWVDLVLVTEIGDHDMVFLNDGTGRFLHGWRFGEVGDNGRAVAFPDLDGDGRPDIVVANRGQPNRVFRSAGADGPEHWYDFGEDDGATVALAAGDLDGDGHPDLVAADWSGDSRGIHVWLNDGSGALVRDGAYGLRNESVFGLDLGDMDGDGDLDIVAVVGQQNPQASDAEGFQYDRWEPGGQDYVLRNDGSGSFPDRIDIGGADDRSVCVELADLDGDGRLDIVIGYARGDDFYAYEGAGREFWFSRVTPGYHGAVFRNDGELRFRGTARFNGHAGAPREILAADANGDGHPDLVHASLYGISPVFLNSLGPAVGHWTADP